MLKVWFISSHLSSQHTLAKALISSSMSARHLSRVSFHLFTLLIRSARRVWLSCSSHFAWNWKKSALSCWLLFLFETQIVKLAEAFPAFRMDGALYNASLALTVIRKSRRGRK